MTFTMFGCRVAVSAAAEYAKLLDVGDVIPPGFSLVTSASEWGQITSERVAEAGRAAGERIASSEREVAAKRRARGLPPLPPVHPELVPDLEAEYADYRRGAA